MKIGKILSIILIACMASLTSANAAVPVSHAGMNANANAANGMVYGLSKKVTKNTEYPPRCVGEVRISEVTPALMECSHSSLYVITPTKESSFETVVEYLISSHGEPYELKHDEKNHTKSALWKTRDGLFMMYMVYSYKLNIPAIKMVVINRLGAGENASNSQNQAISQPYTENTDMPPLKIGDTQFYKGPQTVPGEYEYHTGAVQSDSVFDSVLESLKSSYGPCLQRHYDPQQEDYDMLTAAWVTEDCTFSMDLLLYKYDDGKRFLRLLIYKWPE